MKTKLSLFSNQLPRIALVAGLLIAGIVLNLAAADAHIPIPVATGSLR